MGYAWALSCFGYGYSAMRALSSIRLLVDLFILSSNGSPTISSLVGDLFYWRNIIGFPRYLSLYSIFDQHILEIAVYADRLGGLG